VTYEDAPEKLRDFLLGSTGKAVTVTETGYYFMHTYGFDRFVSLLTGDGGFGSFVEETLSRIHEDEYDHKRKPATSPEEQKKVCRRAYADK
jgi:hypothetical protein